MADDNLIGVARGDLAKLVSLLEEGYERFYLEIEDRKTEVHGVVGIGVTEAVMIRGRQVKIGTQTMQHLGAVMPLKGPVHVVPKAQGNIESVLRLWEQ